MRRFLVDMASGTGPVQYLAIAIGLVAGLWLLVLAVRERAIARATDGSKDAHVVSGGAGSLVPPRGADAARNEDAPRSGDSASGFFKVFVPPADGGAADT